MTKTDIDDKLSSLNRKITSNKTKHLLVENELKELKTSSEKSALVFFLFLLKLLDLMEEIVFKFI